MSHISDTAEAIRIAAEAQALATITSTTVGSTTHDALAGDSDNNRIDGGSGSDTILGYAGDDLLKGDGGNDKLFGNAGDDYMDGGAGNDLLRGGAGDDFIAGGNGTDTLDGGTGNDTLSGGKGDDRLNGHSGDDILYGGEGADQLRGGNGDDTLIGDEADTVFKGGNGFDTLIVDDSNNDQTVAIDLTGSNRIEAVVGADNFDPEADIDTSVNINLQRLLNDSDNADADGNFANTFIAIGIDNLIISDGDLNWRNGDSSAALNYEMASVSLTEEMDIESLLNIDIADNSLFAYTFSQPSTAGSEITIITDLTIEDFTDNRGVGFTESEITPI